MPKKTQANRPPYEEWLKIHGLLEGPDYDMRGAYEAGIEPVDGGMPDEFKLPTHKTYSTESRYSKVKGAPPAGQWKGDDKKGWTFYASPTNIQNAGGVEGLINYFKEPHMKDIKLVLPKEYATPQAKAVGGIVIDDGNPAKRRRLI